MENTPRLYDTLVQVLSQQAKWVDQRHLQTLAWMMVGLMQAGWSSPTAWAPSVVSRARDAQRTVRRFRRWLDTDQIAVLSLYGPLMAQAVAEWGEQALSVALDPSLGWNTDSLIRLAVLSRGRAVPLGWGVLPPGRAQGACEASHALLERAVWLLPRRGKVVFLADRGCAATDLRAHRPRLGWHGRMRIQSSLWLYSRGRHRGQVERRAVARGHAGFWPQGCSTAKRDGPVARAVAQAWPGQDGWEVLSDAVAEGKTCEAYGLRFDIAANCLDETSNGLQLASSLLRSAPALTRLCLVLAMPTRSLVSQGPEVVKHGKRRGVDPHGLRGQSDVKSGWHGVQLALSKGLDLLTTVHVSSACDPEPARASKRQ